MVHCFRSCLLFVWLLVATVAVSAETSHPSAPAVPHAATSGPAAPTPAADNPPASPPVEKTETQEHLEASVKRLTESLTAMQARLDVNRPSAEALKAIGEDLVPLVSEAQALVDRLGPRVAALKAPLDQLGPKPDKGEPPDVAKERALLQKNYDDNDALLKRANVALTLAQRFQGYVALRERTLFTSSLFERATSLLNPQLWSAVVREAPDNTRDLIAAFNNGADEISRDFTAGRLALFLGVSFGLILLYWPFIRLSSRLLHLETRTTTPSEWQKLLVAVWIAAGRSGFVIAALVAITFLFSAFTTTQPWVQPVFAAAQAAIIRIAIVAALARALLSPRRKAWRLVDLDDVTAGKLLRLIITVAVIVSLGKVVEAMNETINASLELTIAVRGLVAALAAIALTAALIDLGFDPDKSSPTTAAQQRDMFGLLRALTWVLIVILAVSVVIGYISFASFLTQQLILVAVTGSILFLATRLLDGLCARAFEPNSRLGHSLLYTIGIRRDTLQQLPVLVSGGGRLALILIAVLVVIAPWGMQSTDLSANLGAIVFGFKVGDVTLSIADVVVALLIFGIALAITRSLQSWLEDRYLPTTRLDPGLRNSIKTSLGYAGFLIALSIAAARLGVDFQKIAIVAGALSVGIGFGLQSIVNNFVSGLILLWERAVRVGDWVVVGADQGYVRKINVRSTEIETFDRALVILPNSNLVSGVVKNLMRADSVGRLNIDLVVNASADPQAVRQVLLDIARANEDVVSLPSPQVRFTDLTASTMSFSLFCFVADVETLARTKSDLYFEICKEFRARKFFDGPPPDPTRIDLTGIDRIEAVLRAMRDRPNDLAARPSNGS